MFFDDVVRKVMMSQVSSSEEFGSCLYAQSVLPHSMSWNQGQSYPMEGSVLTYNSETGSQPQSERKKQCRKVNTKSTYKHIPHREKPPHLVARRNARERRRVQAVNNAFARLRKSVPIENRNKRLSKVKTLHRAIEYINALQDMLSQADDDLSTEVANGDSLRSYNSYLETDVNAVNKENQVGQRWITLESSCEQDSYSDYLPFYDDYSGGLSS
ncbi:achaete-scute homolog 1-like [Centruroides vittatus]|uniref:achaete-scute homolog 1-like n=2 Tax=Centruroides TaxID=6875 RepID=UPI003510A785